MTTPNITTSSNITSITLVPTISAAPESVENSSEKKQQPLFLAGDTPAEKFLSKLYECKLIDEGGRILPDLGKFTLPAMEGNELAKFTQFLQEQICIEIGDKHHFTVHMIKSLIRLKILDQQGQLIHEPDDTAASTEISICNKTLSYRSICDTLMERGFLDQNGKTVITFVADSSNQVPVLQGNHNVLLWRYLNKQPITAQIGNTYYCSVYINKLNFLSTIYAELKDHVHNICYVGGEARYRLKESFSYCERAFEKLFLFLNQTHPEGLISPDLFNTNEKKMVGDEDLRYEEQKAQAEDLLRSTDVVVNYFSSLFFNDKEELHLDWIRKSAFSKLNHIFTGSDHYSIASLHSPQIEIIFHASLTRKQLCSDEIDLDITQMVKENGASTKTAFFHNGPSNGIQALICNLGEIYHIDKPQEVNIYGFFMMVSRFIRGRMICNKEGLKVLVEKTLSLASSSIRNIPAAYSDLGLPGKIAFLIIDNLQKHHKSHLKNAAIAYTFTTCSLLGDKLKPDEITAIWTLADDALSLKSAQYISPFYKLLADLIYDAKIPFQIIESSIQMAGFLRLGICSELDKTNNLSVLLKEIEGMQVIQMRSGDRGDNLSLWTPLSFQKSVESIISYLKNPDTPPEHLNRIMLFIDAILLQTMSEKEQEPYLKRLQACRQVDIQPAVKLGIQLLSGDKPWMKQIGSYLLLSLGVLESEKSTILFILRNFWNAFISQVDDGIKSIFLLQIKQILNKDNNSITQNGISDQNMLLKWMEALTITGEIEHCKIAYDLWLKHQLQLSSKQNIDTATKLFANFIKHAPFLAKSLLQNLQAGSNRFPYEIELQAAGSLIAISKQNTKDRVSVSTLISMGKIVSSFLLLKPHEKLTISENNMRSFAKHFLWLLSTLRESLQVDICLSLLAAGYDHGILKEHRKSIQDEWMKLYIAVSNQSDDLKKAQQAFAIWNLASVHQALPTDNCAELLQTSITLAAKLSPLGNLDEEVIPLLDYIVKLPVISLNDYRLLQQPILNLLARLIDQGRLEEARDKLQNKYTKIIHKQHSITICIKLCFAYINHNDKTQALNLWEKLTSLPSHNDTDAKLLQLTEKLLQLLESDKSDLNSLSSISKILLGKPEFAHFLQPLYHLVEDKFLHLLDKGSIKDLVSFFFLHQPLFVKLQQADSWKEHANRMIGSLIAMKEDKDALELVFKLIENQDLNLLKSENKLLIVQRCLELKDDRKTGMIISLRKTDFCCDLVDPDLLRTFLKTDCDLIRWLIQQKDKATFSFVCDLLKIMLDLMYKHIFVEWYEEGYLLTAYVFENAFQISQHATALTIILQTLLKFPLNEQSAGLIKLCKSLVNHKRIADEVFVFLMILLEAPVNNTEGIMTVQGEALDLALKKYLSFNVMDSYLNAKTILIHENAELHLGPSQYSVHWGKYLLGLVDILYQNPNLSEKVNIFDSLIGHLYLVVNNEETEDKFISRVIDYLVDMIKQGRLRLFTNFTNVFIYNLAHACYSPEHLDADTLGCVSEDDLLMHYDNHIVELAFGPGNYFSISIDRTPNLPPVPIYSCSIEIEHTPNFTLFKKKFIKYSLALLSRIMKTEMSDAALITTYHFMSRNLWIWQEQFSDCQKGFYDIMTQLINWPVFNSQQLDTVHENRCSDLIVRGWEIGLYKEMPEKIVEWMFYLRKQSAIPKKINIKKYSEAALKAIDLCANQKNIFGTTRALDIIDAIFKEFYPAPIPMNINNCIKFIILNSPQSYFYRINKDDSIIDRIFDILFNKFNSNDLLYLLFKSVFQVYQEALLKPVTEETFDPHNMLRWLVGRISLYCTNKWSINVPSSVPSSDIFERHFDFIKKIIPYAVNEMFKHPEHAEKISIPLGNAIFTSQIKNSKLKTQREEVLLMLLKLMLEQTNVLILESACLLSAQAQSFQNDLSKQTIRFLNTIAKPQ